MAEDLIPYAPGQQLSIRGMMSVALAPFRIADQLEDAFEAADRSRDLVKVQNGKLVALELAKGATKEARFRLHCDAHDAMDWMPPGDDLKGHFISIKKAITTKPSDQDMGLGLPFPFRLWACSGEIIGKNTSWLLPPVLW
jgi:hypothetical protein